MRAARVNNQGYAHCLEAATGDLGSRSTGRGWQAGTVHMGEIDTRALEYGSLGQHPAAASTTLGSLPLVAEKIRPAVFFGQSVANAVLQLQQIGSDPVYVDAVI